VCVRISNKAVFACKDGGNSRKISGTLTDSQTELATGIIGIEA
jgi:hypothetical protein